MAYQQRPTGIEVDIDIYDCTPAMNIVLTYTDLLQLTCIGEHQNQEDICNRGITSCETRNVLCQHRVDHGPFGVIG